VRRDAAVIGYDRLPAVGDTVDLSVPTWANTNGAPELSAVWQDPDFDPGERAFFYIRILEIPTPRWTAYDTVKFGFTQAEEVVVKM
jgi:hypothetical protein